MRARIPYIILQSTGGIYLVMLNSSQGVYRPLFLIKMLACVTAAAARLAGTAEGGMGTHSKAQHVHCLYGVCCPVITYLALFILVITIL